MIEYAARRNPRATAVVSGDTTLTFGDLRHRASGVAAAVRARLAPGARVAILAENTADYVTAYYGVPAGGGVLSLLNYRLNPREWAATIEHVEASVVVGERQLLDSLAPVLPGGVETVVALDDAASGEVEFGRWMREPDDPTPPRGPSDADTPAWIIPTSGTTGRPKGATLTHRSLLTAVAGLALARPVQADDVYLFPFPLCHVAGYNVLAFHLYGRPVVLMPRFEAPGVLQLIERHRVTQVSLAPTMIDMVLDEPAFGSVDRSSLRGIGYGASAMPAPILRRTVAEWGVDLSQGYGMTELSGNVAFLGPHEHRRAAAGDERLLRGAGTPSVLASLRIVDDRMGDVEAGEVGEIVVRGDQVMLGYWGDPDATAAAFEGGWLHTGDLGRIDADGMLSVVDRKKDVIVSGGENVASREVEEVLARHAGVKEVAVVGVPDATWGEDVCAVVVTQPGRTVTLDELVALSRAELAGYKKPKHLVVLDALPKNAAGKVAKAELRRRVAEHLGRV